MPELRPVRTVHATITDSGGMLLDTRGRGRWYALTRSGALWWQHLAEGTGPDEAADAVADHFRVPPQQVRADMRTLAQLLTNRRLLTSANTRRRHR